MTGPISRRIMALHSMCQPGRPGPQGESQVGSPGLADFQRAKSEGLRLRLSRATRSPALLSSCAHGQYIIRYGVSKNPYIALFGNAKGALYQDCLKGQDTQTW